MGGQLARAFLFCGALRVLRAARSVKKSTGHCLKRAKDCAMMLREVYET